MQSNISHPRGTVFYHKINFFYKNLALLIIGNYKKNIIFSLIFVLRTMWYFRQLREIQKKWYLRWAFLRKCFFHAYLIFQIILHFVMYPRKFRLFLRIEKSTFFYLLLKYAEKLVHWYSLIKLNIAEGALRNNITEIRQISNIISYICLTLRYVDPDFLFGFLSYLN